VVVAVAVAVGLYGSAMVLSRVLARILSRVFTVGGPGSFTGLFVNTAALHLLGFGIPAAIFLLAHRRRWLSYLRLTECTQWTVFYGTAVGLALMVVTVAATVLFTVFGIEPAESASGQAQRPLFYFVLFVVSSALAVPMEELFFRGLVQRRLTDGTHAVVGISLSSVLFASIHSTVSVGSGGELLAFGMFVGFGVVLGVGYHYTANLFVPIIGHVVFNGVQILLRGLEVAF
jgi:membrane protease YdiL (CAAX protease family)